MSYKRYKQHDIGCRADQLLKVCKTKGSIIIVSLTLGILQLEGLDLFFRPLLLAGHGHVGRAVDVPRGIAPQKRSCSKNKGMFVHVVLRNVPHSSAAISRWRNLSVLILSILYKAGPGSVTPGLSKSG